MSNKDDDDSNEIVELPELPKVPSRVEHTLKMLPLQDAPRTAKNPLQIKRGPGRPRKVERMPQSSDLEYHAEMVLQKERHITNDRIVTTLEKRADTAEVLRVLKEEVAREAAAIEFQRIEQEKRGKESAQLSTRRIEAILKIAALEMELRKLGADVIDLRSEKMSRIFNYWISCIKEVAVATLPPELIDMFFNRLETVMQGWEDRAAEETSNK